MIEVSHISKKYGRREILKDIHFQAKSGECICVAGRNGCGKTTLMRILAGIIKPDGGSVTYFGKDPLRDHKVFLPGTHSSYAIYFKQSHCLRHNLLIGP